LIVRCCVDTLILYVSKFKLKMLYEHEMEDDTNGFDSVDFDDLLSDLAEFEQNEASKVEVDETYDDDVDEDVTTSEDSSIDHEDKRQKISTDVVVTRRRKIKIPRFLVQDIRKCYTKMFQNVMNSGDFPLLYGFLETYYASNPQHSTTKYIRGIPEKIFTMNFYGLDEVAKYWYCIMNMSPDNILQLTDHTIQHTSGKVMSNLHKDGTHIYQDPPFAASYYAPYVYIDEKYGKDNMFVRDSRTNDYIIGHTKHTDAEDLEVKTVERRKEVMRSIMESVDKVVCRLPLRSNPLNVHADGTLIISTDENKRITKMELSIIY